MGTKKKKRIGKNMVWICEASKDTIYGLKYKCGLCIGAGMVQHGDLWLKQKAL
jgi:hypothetical protein